MRAVFLTLAILALPSMLFAQQDVAGGSDHPLVGRFAGAVLDFHRVREYDELHLPVSATTGFSYNSDDWLREMAGKVTSLRYVAPAERTPLEVVRNHQQALEAQGFSTVFFCRGPRDCSTFGAVMYDFVPIATDGMPFWASHGDELVYLLAERNDAEGHVHVAIHSDRGGVTNFEGWRAVAAVTIVEAAPMQTDLIEAPRVIEAGEFEAAFAQDGKIAVYGITFEFNSDALLPDAREQISELGRVMAENPALQVVIVGHTDSIGGFDYNLGLSQRRAMSVVNALATEHGIARDRMTPAGAGMMAPAATNRTEEGRALNRRVEIVERVSQ
jgi:outer membrane protein OmpA-like peptidoglycan-associated protein